MENPNATLTTKQQPADRNPIIIRALIALFWLGVFAALFSFATSIAWMRVFDLLNAVDVRWLPLAAAANLAAFPLWTFCWQLLLQRQKLRASEILRIQLITLAAIQTLSLFGGGAVAVTLLMRAGLSAVSAVSLLTLDQIITGFVKIVLIGMSIQFAHAPDWMRQAGVALLLLMGVVLAVLISSWIARTSLLRIAERSGRRVSLILTFLSNWTANLQPVANAILTLTITLVALLRRLSEGVAILFIQAALGIPVSVETSLLIITLLAITTVIPQPPANLGFFEAAVVFVYTSRGASQETAIAAALLQHAIYITTATVPGLIAIIARRI